MCSVTDGRLMCSMFCDRWHVDDGLMCSVMDGRLMCSVTDSNLVFQELTFQSYLKWTHPDTSEDINTVYRYVNIQ